MARTLNQLIFAAPIMECCFFSSSIYDPSTCFPAWSFSLQCSEGGSLLAAPFLSPGVLGQIELNDGRQEDIAWIGCPGSLSHFLSDYLYV